MSKARKAARKTAGGSRTPAPARSKTAGGKKKVATRRAAGGTKKVVAGRKKARANSAKPSTRRPRPLNLTGLKAQIRKHVEKLTDASARTTDRRVSEALTSLQRVYRELADTCGSTMMVPLA